MSDSKLSELMASAYSSLVDLVQDDEGGQDRCPPRRLTTGGSSAQRGFECVHRGERAIVIGSPDVPAVTGPWRGQCRRLAHR
jgi:hypothetical protein